MSEVLEKLLKTELENKDFEGAIRGLRKKIGELRQEIEMENVYKEEVYGRIKQKILDKWVQSKLRSFNDGRIIYSKDKIRADIEEMAKVYKEMGY